MALIVEDGTGLPDADAYVSVVDVDAYNDDYIGSTSWDAADEPTKERSIRQATQYLDITYHRKWRGRKMSEEQALDWPRSLVVTRDGYILPDDELPIELVRACSEAAIRAASGDTLIEDVKAGGGLKKIKQKVAVLEEEKEYFDPGQNSETQMSYPTICKLLTSGDLILPGSIVVRA